MTSIVFVGDVAQDGGVPYLGDSYPSEWPETDDRMVELPIERFMSGHGPVGDHAALVEARDFIHALVDAISGPRSEMAKTKGAASVSVVDALSSRVR